MCSAWRSAPWSSRPECRRSEPRRVPQRSAQRPIQVPQSHELFACSSNLPLSLLTGLADGLALKDRATRLGGRDSPQHVGPPLSLLFQRRETQRKCAAHPSKGLLVIRHPTVDRPFTHEPSPRKESPTP